MQVYVSWMSVINGYLTFWSRKAAHVPRFNISWQPSLLIIVKTTLIKEVFFLRPTNGFISNLKHDIICHVHFFLILRDAGCEWNLFWEVIDIYFFFNFLVICSRYSSLSFKNTEAFLKFKEAIVLKFEVFNKKFFSVGVTDISIFFFHR